MTIHATESIIINNRFYLSWLFGKTNVVLIGYLTKPILRYLVI